MKRITDALLLACALLPFAAGCASTGESRLTQPVAVKLNQFKTATVSVKSTMTKPPQKMDEFMAQLESRIIAKLRAEETFEKVYAAAADSEAGLQIAVTIWGVRDINTFNRMMWGGLAGQAKVEAVLHLRDQAAGTLLSSAEILGKSSSGTVFAGTTPEAVDRVADEVVRLVRENM